MARARNIKPGFFMNEDLIELSFETRLLFIGLWTLADRDGRLEDRPKKIKMEIFPCDNVDCETLLQHLNDKGFVLRYEASGTKVIQIVNFSKHQKPHPNEKPSELPAFQEISDQDAPNVSPRCEVGTTKDIPNRADIMNVDIMNEDIPEVTPKGVPCAPKNPKTKYADDVFMTKAEYEKLCTALGKSKADEYIQDLSLYKGSKGKKYKSDYKTVLAWARKDSKGQPKPDLPFLD